LQDKVMEKPQSRGYQTREDVGALRKYIRRELSWSTVRQPLSILIAVFIWHLLTEFDAPLFKQVPTPIEVGKEANRYVFTQVFGLHSYWSNIRVLIGFVIAGVLGIPFGLAMGYKRVFNEYTFPLFEVLRPIPPLAWLPLSVIMFPTSEMSIVYLVFLGAFFPIVLNTLLGVLAVGETYRWAALSLGASPRDIFRHVILPAATPAVFTGMQIATGMCWIMVVASEMVAGGYGLGYMTWEAYVTVTYPRIVLGMITIGLSGFILSALVRYIGVKFMPWRQLF